LQTGIGRQEMLAVKHCRERNDEAVVTYSTHVKITLHEVFLEHNEQIILILILCSEFVPSCYILINYLTIIKQVNQDRDSYRRTAHEVKVDESESEKR
jgi:hypothetical protein